MDFNHYYDQYYSWIAYNFSTFQIVDAILFVLCSFCVLYLLIFVLAAKIKRKRRYPSTRVQTEFMVVISVYGDDKLIFKSIDSVLEQNYNSDKVLVAVIANNCSEKFLHRIENCNVTVITKRKEWKSILTLGDYLEVLYYNKTNNIKVDIISFIHSGDTFEQNCLVEINNAYYCGCDAIQIGRYFEKIESIPAILEDVREDVNNTIFRDGHTALGFSSAVMDSGISFKYEIFCEIMDEVSDSYPEKQIEAALLKRNIYIEYLNYVYICRLQKIDSYKNHKAKQTGSSVLLSNFLRSAYTLPKSLYERKIDYCNKIIQWMLPSRVVLTVLMVIFMVLVAMINWTLGIKWLILILILTMIYFVSIPSYLMNRRLMQALILAPFYLVITLFKMIFSRR